MVAMNEVVLKQHSLFREKVKTEKSLTAIKRKREDDVFDEFQFSIQDLRFRKSYCQEVEEFCESLEPKTKVTSANNFYEGMNDIFIFHYSPR